MRFAKREMIHETPSMPIAARISEIGIAMPAPLPVSDAPPIAVRKNVTEKTGPMKPTACATTSASRRFPRPSFAGSAVSSSAIPHLPTGCDRVGAI